MYRMDHVAPMDRLDRAAALARWPLAAAYLAAGLLHVARPAPFLAITPAWVPWPDRVILLTGLCEVAGAIGLLLPRWRRRAGFMLALYAVCVYPANLHHAFAHVRVGSATLGWWYHGPRLAAQPLIVWWALFAGGIVRWPFGRGAASAGG